MAQLAWNNPGNIGFGGFAAKYGAVASSQSDTGHMIAQFPTPQAGVQAMSDLALNKYNNGATSLNTLIAGNGGWTPGNYTAASNIANTMGISPNADLQLNNPANMSSFQSALARQEGYGSANQQSYFGFGNNSANSAPGNTAPSNYSLQNDFSGGRADTGATPYVAQSSDTPAFAQGSSLASSPIAKDSPALGGYTPPQGAISITPGTDPQQGRYSVTEGLPSQSTTSPDGVYPQGGSGQVGPNASGSASITPSPSTSGSAGLPGPLGSILSPQTATSPSSGVGAVLSGPWDALGVTAVTTGANTQAQAATSAAQTTAQATLNAASQNAKAVTTAAATTAAASTQNTSSAISAGLGFGSTFLSNFKDLFVRGWIGFFGIVLLAGAVWYFMTRKENDNENDNKGSNVFVFGGGKAAPEPVPEVLPV